MTVLKVIGLGDPVMDILVEVSHEELAAVVEEPGGCISIDEGDLTSMLSTVTSSRDNVDSVPGGSAANVLKGLANLADGEVDCYFLGMLGMDDTGKTYTEKLRGAKVASMMQETKSGAATARCLCMVTPDGQRTMRTCHGASREFGPSGLQDGWTSGASLLHLEGYMLWKPELAEAAMTAARAAGMTVSMDLASFETVRIQRDILMKLLAKGLVDILFCNEDEAVEVSAHIDGVNADPERPASTAFLRGVQDNLLQHTQICVISRGERGCIAKNCNGETAIAPACKVQMGDTIGAGDCFTSGPATDDVPASEAGSSSRSSSQHLHLTTGRPPGAPAHGAAAPSPSRRGLDGRGPGDMFYAPESARVRGGSAKGGEEDRGARSRRGEDASRGGCDAGKTARAGPRALLLAVVTAALVLAPAAAEAVPRVLFTFAPGADPVKRACGDAFFGTRYRSCLADAFGPPAGYFFRGPGPFAGIDGMAEYAGSYSWDYLQALETMIVAPDTAAVHDGLRSVLGAGLRGGDGAVPSVAGLLDDTIMELDADPSDPLYPAQRWYFEAIGITGMDAEPWASTRGCEDVVVAIVDTGVDYGHADLAGNMWVNPGEIPGNGLDDDNDGFVDNVYGADFGSLDGDPFDVHGHGTHVAGIVGARGDNGVGVTGVAQTVKLMALKIHDEAANRLAFSAASQALNFALVKGAHVSNHSYGAAGAYLGYYALDHMNAVQRQGHLFVTSAGNDATNNDDERTEGSTSLPASQPHEAIVSVCATDGDDRLAHFSAYGQQTVDVCAPGTNIASTAAGGAYVQKSGTSMAAPIVAGAAALMLCHVKHGLGRDIDISAAAPGYALEVKKSLLRTATHHAALDATSLADGVIDVPAAIADLADRLTATQSASPYVLSGLPYTIGPVDPVYFIPGYHTSRSATVSLAPAAACDVGKVTVATRVDGEYLSHAGIVLAHGGDAVTLMRGVGGATAVHRRRLVFDDDAATPIASVGDGEVFAGAYAPQEALGRFAGADAAGDWTLTLVDTTRTNPHTLSDWSVTVTCLPSPGQTPTGARGSVRGDPHFVGFGGQAFDYGADSLGHSFALISTPNTQINAMLGPDLLHGLAYMTSIGLMTSSGARVKVGSNAQLSSLIVELNDIEVERARVVEAADVSVEVLGDTDASIRCSDFRLSVRLRNPRKSACIDLTEVGVTAPIASIHGVLGQTLPVAGSASAPVDGFVGEESDYHVADLWSAAFAHSRYAGAERHERSRMRVQSNRLRMMIPDVAAQIEGDAVLEAGVTQQWATARSETGSSD